VGFAATANVTAPLPVPAAPDTIKIHVALLAAVHVQPEATDTETEELPVPPDGTDTVFGVTEAEHAVEVWVTVMLCPAMVSVPVRVVPLFAEALNPTEPLPVPAAPDVTVSQEVLLTAVHAHPSAVWTEIGTPAPPAAAIDVVVGVITYEQEADAWLTRIV
jgi:hypothetical protein